MNTIVLIGRLARDPETKLASTRKGQTKVSRFPLVEMCIRDRTNLPQLFEKYKRQYVGNKYFQLALGFHPELVHQYSNQQVLFKELINETRFIGEIGLDYTKKSKEDVMCQTEIFEKIIEWCSGKNKILSVHSRSASKKVVDILNGFDGTVILHWYSGGITDLRRAIEQGCYFSINHQMLQSVNGRNIVGNIPVDRILLESDAPFTKGLSEKYTIDFNDILAPLSVTMAVAIFLISLFYNFSFTIFYNSCLLYSIVKY